MVYSLHKIVFITLIFAIAAPTAFGRRAKLEMETDLRDLCSHTNESGECWKIIKSSFSQFENRDSRGLAGVIIDLAIAKSDEIHDKLNALYSESRNDTLKEKYILCSKNYNDANRNLLLAKTNLDLNDYRNIPVQVDDTIQELEDCKRDFDNYSFDPAHIKNRNKEFGVYVDMVKVATDRLLSENDRS